MKPQYFDFNPDQLGSIPSYGYPNPKYAVVGIAPPLRRNNSADFNQPFGEKSLWSLRTHSERWFNDGEVYFTHLVKSNVPMGKSPGIKVIRKALPRFKKEIEALQPRRILVLGSEAASHLCPGFTEMREDHGTIFYNEELHCHLVPTYELPTIAYREHLRPLFKRDVERFFTLPNPVEPVYTVITIDQLKFKKGCSVVLDIETEGFDPYQDGILSIGMAELGKFSLKGIQILLTPSAEEVSTLLDYFIKQGITVIIHNAQFDLYFMAVKSGHKLEGLKVEDTMLLAHHSGEDTLNLKHLTTILTDRPGSHAFGSFENLAYLAEDVLSTMEIYPIFDEKVGDIYARRLLNDFMPHLINVRIQGVHVSRSVLQEANDFQRKLVEERLAIINKVALIDWNSPKQVGLTLRQVGVPLVDRTKTEGYKVGEPILLPFANDYPIVKDYLAYKEATGQEKFTTGYLDDTSEDHPFLHPQLVLTGTTTGRLSCRNPNLQQVPRVGPAKSAFISRNPDGYIALIDLSQAELRVAALLCGDKNFAKMLMSGDAHRSIAAQLWGKPEDEVTAAERKKSKGATFGLLYGGSAKGLGFRLGVSPREIDKIMAGFFKKFPGLMKWLDDTKKFGVANQYIMTPFGRRRDLAELMLTEGPKSVERKACNTPVQGTASDIALTIFSNATKYLVENKAQTFPMIGVHDSILLDVASKEEIPVVANAVLRGFQAIDDTPLSDFPLYKNIPFEGELVIAKSWAEVESTNEGYNPLYKFPMSNRGGKKEWPTI